MKSQLATKTLICVASKRFQTKAKQIHLIVLGVFSLVLLGFPSEQFREWLILIPTFTVLNVTLNSLSWIFKTHFSGKSAL